MDENNVNISLDDLIDQDWLSSRSINICRNSGLISLFHILDFHLKWGSFMQLKNCGVKTDRELIELCKKYNELRSNTMDSTPEKVDTLLDKFNSLSPFQRATLNRHIEYLISKLSIRAYTGLGNISKSYNLKEIFEVIIFNKFNFKTIKNIGDKSVKELEIFKYELIKFANILISTKNEQLNKEYVKLILKARFKDFDEDFERRIETFFDDDGKLKLFALLKFLIDSGKLFSEIENKVFSSYYTYGAEEKSLLSIAKESSLTRERIRQIKVKLESQIQVHFLFVSNFLSDDLTNYSIDETKIFQIIGHQFAKIINESEGVNFNFIFYSIIFGIFLKKSHSALGNIEPLYGKRRTFTKQKYKNCYLINSLLFDCFDFGKFTDDVYAITNNRVTESYSLHFQGYLSQFLKVDGKSFFDEIKYTCEAIVFNEFELVISYDGYLTIEQNTKRQVHFYCYEVLDEVAKPMTIIEIESALKKRYPHMKTSIDSLRGSLNREKGVFIYFGRSSMYGLKKWENEKSNIKGGTIRDLAEEFLVKNDSPKHISEILEFITRFRPDTNEKSVITNLKSEESNKFTFYSGEFIGLSSMSYPAETTRFKKIIGSHFRVSVLKKMNGWDFNRVINYYVKNFNYRNVQIEFLLKRKIVEGELKISDNNQIII